MLLVPIPLLVEHTLVLHEHSEVQLSDLVMAHQVLELQISFLWKILVILLGLLRLSSACLLAYFGHGLKLALDLVVGHYMLVAGVLGHHVGLCLITRTVTVH